MEKQDCAATLASTEEAIEALTTQIEQKENRRRELDLACAQSSVFQEEERLRNQKNLLLEEQKKLMQDLQALAIEIKRDALWWNALCSSIMEFDSEEVLIPAQDAAEEVLKTYGLFTSGNYCRK